MRRAFLGLLLLLLLPMHAMAQSALPQLMAEKHAVADAPAGAYAYTLTIQNLGEQALERIFVEESGAMGGMALPVGAFVHFSGADVLLNQNGTATILSLAPGQTVSLRYEGPLPQDYTAAEAQTHCALSALYTDATGKQYVLLSSADQAVALLPAATAADLPPAQDAEATAGGGVLSLALEKTSYADAVPGATYENCVTLTNTGTGELSGISLRMDAVRTTRGKLITGEWLDTGGWTPCDDGALEQPAGETLLPGESMVFRCCWTLPEDFDTEAEGSVSAWTQSGTEGRQDVCALFRLSAQDAPWMLRLTPEIALTATDCAWIAATLALCAVMALRFRPGRFQPRGCGGRKRKSGVDSTTAA